MRSKFILFIIFLLTCSPYFLNSTPFIQGNVLDSPNAHLLQHSYIQFSGIATFYDQDHIMQAGDFNSIPKYTLGLDLKVGAFNWVELGVAYVGTQVWTGFVKGRILKESGAIPAIAIGVQNMTPFKRISDYGSNTFTYYKIAQNFSMYGVITKDISYINPSIPVTLSLGIGTGRFQGERDRSEPWKGIFTSIEVRPVKNLTIISDIDGKDWNIASVYRVNYNLELLFAWTEIEQTFGVNYTHRTHPTEQQKIQMGFRMTYGPFFGQELAQRRQREFEIMRSYETELEEIRRKREEAERELERLRRILEETGG